MSNCKKETENLDHILSNCGMLREEYFRRHNNVAKNVYNMLAKTAGIKYMYKNSTNGCSKLEIVHGR